MLVGGWQKTDMSRSKKSSDWIKRNFLPMRTVKQQKRLPREAVQSQAVLSPSWEVFKTQMSKNLSNLFWLQSWPCFKQEVRIESSRCPFQLELSCNCIIITVNKLGNIRNYLEMFEKGHLDMIWVLFFSNLNTCYLQTMRKSRFFSWFFFLFFFSSCFSFPFLLWIN